MPNFIEEIRRRNVFRVAVAYLVITWLVLQVADTAAPLLGLPEWVNSLVLFIMAILFIPTLIFAWAFELTPEGIKRQEEVDRDESIVGETGKRLNYVTIGALVLVLAFVASDRWLFPEATVSEPAASAISVEPGEVSIAVLPFADMSPNNDQEYFSDGISEEILNGLAKIRTIKVAGRTSAFAFKGRNEDLREIGAALGVEHVLEGSVRKSGNQLRITAQLIKVSDGFHLWSETYDRELIDVFAIQDEISAAIVNELQGSLLGNSEPVVSDQAIDVATFEKYLAARELIHMRTNEGLTEARAMLEEIVEAAPYFAPGLSSLAESLTLLRIDSFSAYGDLDPDEVTALATPLLERAIELDPNYADAYAVLGLLQDDNKDFENSRRNLLHAVDLNPSLSKAWVWLSNLAGRDNQRAERRRYLEKAAAIDPLWLVPNSNFLYINLEVGRIDEVWEILERLRPFHQDSAMFHGMDARAKNAVGDLAGVYRASVRAYELSPDTPAISSNLGMNLVNLQEFARAVEVMPPQFAVIKNYVSGEWDEALPVLRQAVDDDPRQPIPIFVYATGALYVGDYEGLVDIYDTHIRSPETISTDFQNDLMLSFASALRALNRNDEAESLLDAYHAGLLDAETHGTRNAGQHFSWARYLALRGDRQGALAKLESSIDEGIRIGFWQYQTEFAPFSQDARFVEVQERNRIAINESRAELGWDPVAEVGVFYTFDGE